MNHLAATDWYGLHRHHWPALALYTQSASTFVVGKYIGIVAHMRAAYRDQAVAHLAILPYAIGKL